MSLGVSDYAYRDQNTRVVFERQALPEVDQAVRDMSRIWQKTGDSSSIPKYRFEEMFPIMVLDENGKCEQCQQVEMRTKV